MYITKGKFEEICKKHGTLLIVEEDVAEAFNFVREVLEAEADALKAHEPNATHTIKQLDIAAYEVFSVGQEVENEDFFE